MLKSLVLLLVLVAFPRWTRADTHRPPDASELSRVLRSHIAQTVLCPESDVEVRSAGSLEGTDIPDGDVTFRILQKSVPVSYRNQLIGVEIVRGERPVRTFWVTVDASVRGRFVRTIKRVPYGTALTPGDLEVVEAELPDLRAHYFKAAEEVVGQVTRRLLAPGDALTTEMVLPPYLVRCGQTVRLRVQRDRVTVAALARAEQDGRLGQVVAIRNLDFSRRLKARVVGPGEVMID